MRATTKGTGSHPLRMLIAALALSAGLPGLSHATNTSIDDVREKLSAGQGDMHLTRVRARD